MRFAYKEDLIGRIWKARAHLLPRNAAFELDEAPVKDKAARKAPPDTRTNEGGGILSGAYHPR
ncbi:MAG: hypothetical protein H6558_19650 [Lewinellaceae bacterium]|nr:hypothetical protein [Lewinellaceae bacterium]